MADILLLARPTATGLGGSTPTPADDADIGAIGGLRRATSGGASLYADDNVTSIDIGGGTSVTNIGISAGDSNDLTLAARAGSITLNEAGQVALDANFSATSIIGAVNELNNKATQFLVFAPTSTVSTGPGKLYFIIPDTLNGLNLIRAQAAVITAGTTNSTDIMIHNLTDGNDMLSGAGIVIASGATIGTPATINTSFDDVATDDIIRIDVDAVSDTAPLGLIVVLTFGL